MKNIILLIVTIILLFSCSGNEKRKNNKNNITKEIEQKNYIEENIIISSTEEITEEIKERIMPKNYATEEEKENVKDILNKNEHRLIEQNIEIDFIEKANFGISGGENWIVKLSDNSIIVYAINENTIIKRFLKSSTKYDRYTTFDIMQDIPGMHIENSSSSFGDFNGDGVDELFQYGFGGDGFYIFIHGYNSDEDNFKYFFSITSDIIDPIYGPAPIEFVTYNGILGFKIYFVHYFVWEGTNVVPSENIKSEKWFFYTWDANVMKYVEVMEIND